MPHQLAQQRMTFSDLNGRFTRRALFLWLAELLVVIGGILYDHHASVNVYVCHGLGPLLVVRHCHVLWRTKFVRFFRVFTFIAEFSRLKTAHSPRSSVKYL